MLIAITLLRFAELSAFEGKNAHNFMLDYVDPQMALLEVNELNVRNLDA